MKLMIVDDEEFVREVIGESVSDLFTDVAYAVDGLDAYEKLAEFKPDVIISDFNMPKLDGLELLKLLNEKNIRIPMVWLSGRGSQQVKRDAWSFGIYDYFEKPFDVDEIRRCLCELKNQIASQELTSMNELAKRITYDQISLLLDKPTFRAFHERCLQDGTSATTRIQKLIEGYMTAKV